MVERVGGTAADLHHRAAEGLRTDAAQPVRRTVRIVEPDGPAVVLGSTQSADHLDAARLRAAGVSLARRRSGGSAVLVGDGRSMWIDLVLPRADPLWDDDVSRSGLWVGRAWAEAVGDTVPGPVGAGVWSGPLRRSVWSDRVCFAGLGPGEVTLGDGKVVGVSQRRTRAGALFQCAALLRWEARPLVDLLALGPAEGERAARDMAGVGRGVGTDRGPALLAALLHHLPGPVAG